MTTEAVGSVKSRWIRPTVHRTADLPKDVPFAGATDTDGYWQRLVTYIPGEVVAAWIAVSGLIEGMLAPRPSEAAPVALTAALAVAGVAPAGGAFGLSYRAWYWIAFAICLALSVVYLWFGTDPKRPSARIVQTVTAPLAFTVWVIALGGPFQMELGESYSKGMASLILVLFSALLPAIDLVKDRSGR